MKKFRCLLLTLLIMVFVASNMMPAFCCYASEVFDEGAEDEAGETTEETESVTDGIPDTYYKSIETNEIKNWPQGPMVEAGAAVVMDADTGAFLYSKSMEEKEYPASITKIMTVLVAIENWPADKLDKKIKASETALAPIDSDSSQIWLSVGEKITMRQALYAIMLASANDAANVVAEYVGGSIDGFVDMMNAKAEELGCVNTHFMNPHGLHDDNHYTCAHDMALITQAAYQSELFRTITGTVEYKIPKTKYMKEDRWLVNHQKMLYDDEYKYDYCVGGKTGFTDNALNTLVTIAKKDGQTLICVELYVNGAWKTFNESKELLNYGFNNFRQENMPSGIENKTLGQLAGETRFGNAALLNTTEMNTPALNVSSTIKVTLPNDIMTEKLFLATKSANEIAYTYRNWEVGSTKVSYNSPLIDIAEPQVREIEVESGTEETKTSTGEAHLQGMNESTKETTGVVAIDKANSYLDRITGDIMGIWTAFDNWVAGNEIPAAILGMVLIVLLVPLLIVAYIRDRNARRMDKEREVEREARQKMEENIDSKSIQEIEAEIRAELEKERIEKEKEAARKREAEEEEKRMKELEAVISEKEKSVQPEKTPEDDISAEDKGNKEENKEMEEKV